ncbi:MAG: hypothetical protein IPI41_12245 [Flavobacteriales bacterium]|nr:hypothetical protein [Flavobacteriales bacterium]
MFTAHSATVASSVHGNTIAGIELGGALGGTSIGGVFTGISVLNGLVDIGTAGEIPSAVSRCRTPSW